MKVKIDLEAEATYIELSTGKVHRSVDLSESFDLAILDVAKDGTILGLELVGNVQLVKKLFGEPKKKEG